jgi:hypothetical protein
MAYAQGPVTKTAEAAPDRQNMITYAWSDTDVQAGSEAMVDGLPKRGIIKRFTATLTGGTGTTINPTIGRASGFSANTQNQVLAAPGAAAHIDAGPVYYFSEDGPLYVVATPDAGTDNAVSYELLIVAGWND